VGEPITLAVIPSVTAGDTREALDRLCGALGGILQTEVTSMRPESYDALAAELERGRVQYAWTPPALLVLTMERVRLQPLLSAVRGGRTEFCAVLFVRAESSIRSLHELRGTTVAWVDEASAAGYLCPRLHLAAQGIDPTTLFGKELFLRSHPEVVRAVFDGRADVGATYAFLPEAGKPVERAAFHDVAPGRPARVLEHTAPIPNDGIAGHGLMTWPEHRAFSRAIMDLAGHEDGRRLLEAVFHADRFTPSPPESLRPLRALVEQARRHGLLHYL
jgi:phosphonate transport system substrate-binding protein